MPTPKAWLDNLERLQRYTGAHPEADLPHVEATPKEGPSPETADQFMAAFQEVVENMEQAADVLMDALKDADSDEGKRNIIAGFLTGLAMKIIATIAYEQQNR